jgi:hypothetical protein
MRRWQVRPRFNQEEFRAERLSYREASGVGGLRRCTHSGPDLKSRDLLIWVKRQRSIGFGKPAGNRIYSIENKEFHIVPNYLTKMRW